MPLFNHFSQKIQDDIASTTSIISPLTVLNKLLQSLSSVTESKLTLFAGDVSASGLCKRYLPLTEENEQDFFAAFNTKYAAYTKEYLEKLLREDRVFASVVAWVNYYSPTYVLLQSIFIHQCIHDVITARKNEEIRNYIDFLIENCGSMLANRDVYQALGRVGKLGSSAQLDDAILVLMRACSSAGGSIPAKALRQLITTREQLQRVIKYLLDRTHLAERSCVIHLSYSALKTLISPPSILPDDIKSDLIKSLKKNKESIQRSMDNYDKQYLSIITEILNMLYFPKMKVLPYHVKKYPRIAIYSSDLNLKNLIKNVLSYVEPMVKSACYQLSHITMSLPQKNMVIETLLLHIYDTYMTYPYNFYKDMLYECLFNMATQGPFQEVEWAFAKINSYARNLKSKIRKVLPPPSLTNLIAFIDLSLRIRNHIESSYIPNQLVVSKKTVSHR